MTDILHKHHRVPKHQGGTDDPSNLVEVSVAQHAELHFALYLEHGHWQDWCAAYFLDGQISDKELISIRNSHNRSKAKPPSAEANKRRSETMKQRIKEGLKRTNPYHSGRKRNSQGQFC